MNNLVYGILLLFFIAETTAEEHLSFVSEGGGGLSIGHQDQQSEFESLNRWYQYMKDRDRLIASGQLTINGKAVSSPKFILPLRNQTTDPGFYGISNFVDQDPSYPNQLRDYMCGTRTYDLSSGYNHQGIDFFTFPFGWHKMDNDQVAVVAAAAGTITTKIDGNYDRNCTLSSSNWNAVYVTYPDGSYSWYGHLKNGSLTNKSVGQTVQAGEYLGIVGSSGSSTAAHLHFETYDRNHQLIEPYAGTCNNMNSQSWWQNQPPYKEGVTNLVATHNGVPGNPYIGTCPASNPTDSPKFDNHFNPGEYVWFASYHKDQELGQVIEYKIIMPDGQIANSWSVALGASHDPYYPASWWYRNLRIGNAAPHGAWKFTVDYNGGHHEHVFFVGDLIFKNGFE